MNTQCTHQFEFELIIIGTLLTKLPIFARIKSVILAKQYI